MTRPVHNDSSQFTLDVLTCRHRSSASRVRQPRTARRVRTGTSAAMSEAERTLYAADRLNRTDVRAFTGGDARDGYSTDDLRFAGRRLGSGLATVTDAQLA